MEIKNRLENLEKFKKCFDKENIKEFGFDDFLREFKVENYFLGTDIIFLEKNFYEVLLDIFISYLKNFLQEIEYYVNLKPNNLILKCDFEVLESFKEKNTNFYLNFHLLYKKFHKLYVLNKTCSKEEVLSLTDLIFKIVVDFKKHSVMIQDKFIENIDKKILELNKKKEELKFESSIYS